MLFKTTSELQQYIAIDVNMNFKRIKPSIEQAEAEFIVELLGKEQYDELVAAYEPGPPTGALLALLAPVQKALANYAAFLAVEELGVSVGDAGIQQQSSANSQPAPAWKVKDLKLKYINTADRSADLLLEFLEDTAVIPDGGVEADRVYKKWYDSEANTALSGCIVYKTSIASKYIDINNSRRLFLRLKKRIKEIESSYLLATLCTDQFEEVINQVKAPATLTDANKELIKLLEPIVSKRALYATLPVLPVIITSKGLFLQSSNDSVIQNMQAGPNEVGALMKQLKDDEYTGYLADEARLAKFIKDNIADYPLISASPCYNDAGTSPDERWKIENDPCNKHFST